MGSSTGPTASRHRRARDEQACRGPPDTITAIKGGLLIVCRRPLSLGTLATNPATGWRHPKRVLSLIHSASQWVNVGVVSARFRFATRLVVLLRGVLLPFVTGIALAYLLNPVAGSIERLGIGRLLATLAMMGIVVITIAVSLFC